MAAPAIESVQCFDRKKTGCVRHSQILRIREEDSHLGESAALIGAAAAAGKDYHGIDVVRFTRPILPSSPLKSTINRQEVENPTPTTPAPTKFLLLPTKTQLKSVRSVTTFFSRFASTKKKLSKNLILLPSPIQGSERRRKHQRT
ncbi:hypothetical protein TB1_009736 [Malus domestica]